MKTAKILNCLMLSIPFNALAHPGHEGGALESVVAGLAGGQLPMVSILPGLGLALVATWLFRRRKSVRADD